jgi:hypothetical protein
MTVNRAPEHPTVSLAWLTGSHGNFCDCLALESGSAYREEVTTAGIYVSDLSSTRKDVSCVTTLLLTVVETGGLPTHFADAIDTDIPSPTAKPPNL